MRRWHHERTVAGHPARPARAVEESHFYRDRRAHPGAGNRREHGDLQRCAGRSLAPAALRRPGSPGCPSRNLPPGRQFGRLFKLRGLAGPEPVVRLDGGVARRQLQFDRRRRTGAIAGKHGLRRMAGDSGHTPRPRSHDCFRRRQNRRGARGDAESRPLAAPLRFRPRHSRQIGSTQRRQPHRHRRAAQ